MDLLQLVMGGKLTSHTSTNRDVPEVTIGADAYMRGTLVIHGRLRIHGSFEGELEVTGDVVIGTTGRVVAPIKATTVHVSGAVKGNLVVEQHVEISETGKVWGDISSRALLIEPGGLFQGQSFMVSTEEPLFEVSAPAS